MQYATTVQVSDTTADAQSDAADKKSYWQPRSIFDWASLLGMQSPEGKDAGAYLERLGSYNASFYKRHQLCNFIVVKI